MVNGDHKSTNNSETAHDNNALNNRYKQESLAVLMSNKINTLSNGSRNRMYIHIYIHISFYI